MRFSVTTSFTSSSNLYSSRSTSCCTLILFYTTWCSDVLGIFTFFVIIYFIINEYFAYWFLCNCLFSTLVLTYYITVLCTIVIESWSTFVFNTNTWTIISNLHILATLSTHIIYSINCDILTWCYTVVIFDITLFIIFNLWN